MVMLPKLAWDVDWILSGERNGNGIGEMLIFVPKNASQRNEYGTNSLYSL